MKIILIIAGPNGAGKTTFAREFLPNEAACPMFVNADLIAAGLSPFQPDKVAITAGRMMLERIRQLVDSGEIFAFETTLSTRGFLRAIPDWQRRGYRVFLHFLKLPSAEFAAARVAQRVKLGGHDIPPQTIARRFRRGLHLLRHGYLDQIDQWSIYDGSENPPRLLETGPGKMDSLMEDDPPYQASESPPKKKHVDHDAMIEGALAALKRGAAKAVARDLAAGLQPIVRQPNPDPPDPPTKD